MSREKPKRKRQYGSCIIIEPGADILKILNLKSDDSENSSDNLDDSDSFDGILEDTQSDNDKSELLNDSFLEDKIHKSPKRIPKETKKRKVKRKENSPTRQRRKNTPGNLNKVEKKFDSKTIIEPIGKRKRKPTKKYTNYFSELNKNLYKNETEKLDIKIEDIKETSSYASDEHETEIVLQDEGVPILEEEIDDIETISESELIPDNAVKKKNYRTSKSQTNFKRSNINKRTTQLSTLNESENFQEKDNLTENVCEEINFKTLTNDINYFESNKLTPEEMNTLDMFIKVNIDSENNIQNNIINQLPSNFHIDDNITITAEESNDTSTDIILEELNVPMKSDDINKELQTIVIESNDSKSQFVSECNTTLDSLEQDNCESLDDATSYRLKNEKIDINEEIEELEFLEDVISYDEISHETKEGSLKTMYNCRGCDFAADQKQKILVHINSVHRNKHVQMCGVCSFTTVFQSHLEIHQRKHKTYCDKCDYMGTSRLELLRHIRREHPTDRTPEFYSCHICDFHTEKKLALKSHIKNVHDTEGLYYCPDCNYSTTVSKDYKKHVYSVHQKKELFKCIMCDYSAIWESQLKYHIKTVHSEEKPYACNECGARFKTTSNRNNHIRKIHQ